MFNNPKIKPKQLMWNSFKAFCLLMIVIEFIVFWILMLVFPPAMRDGVPWSVAAQEAFNHDKGDMTLNWLSFFTIQSNLIVGLWFFCSLFWWRKENHVWFLSKEAVVVVTTYISITFLVYNCFLLPFAHPASAASWVQSVCFHMINPICMVVYFCFGFPKREGELFQYRQYLKTDWWKVVIYPVAWLVVNMIRGEFRWNAGKSWPYQYYFMYIHSQVLNMAGWIWLIIFVIVILLLIFIFTSLYLYTYNRIAKKSYLWSR